MRNTPRLLYNTTGIRVEHDERCFFIVKDCTIRILFMYIDTGDTWTLRSSITDLYCQVFFSTVFGVTLPYISTDMHGDLIVKVRHLSHATGG